MYSASSIQFQTQHERSSSFTRTVTSEQIDSEASDLIQLPEAISASDSMQQSVSISSSQNADAEESPDYIRKLILQKLFNQQEIEAANISIEELEKSAVQNIDFNFKSELAQVVSIQHAAVASPVQNISIDVRELANSLNLATMGQQIVTTTSLYHEEESLNYNAEGSIRLDSGQRVEFSLTQQYQREYTQLDITRMNDPELKDPLVVSLDSGPISFSGQQHAFDIDADGEEDNIYQLDAGAAYLAIDHNGNGKIDDGSELIGTKTGNGFAELAAYDENQDGVINRHDSIFESLMLWRYSSGVDELSKVSNSNINTFSLQSTNTPYTFTDEHNQPLAIMRQSGVYANNDGSVGGLHQVDLVV